VGKQESNVSTCLSIDEIVVCSKITKLNAHKNNDLDYEYSNNL